MSKMIPATCVGGVVTAEGVPVAAATILSEGVGQSEGVVLLDEDEARYIAKISPDLKTTIERLISTIEKSVQGLTACTTAFSNIAAAMTGVTTAPPPTLAADLAAITLAGTNLTAIGVQLTTLKEGLK